ncbi:MAG TPA: tetratricopeptide repeat protein [Micropepsaceae bacterium]|nr:tetratricopeptide repeat protein [Micropepsaceae bacterium]
MNEALLASAVRAHQAGNLAEAARLYSAVLKGAPRNFQAIYLLGFIKMQQGSFDEAEQLIGEATRINPQAPDAFYNRGCALQHLQRHQEALAAFDRALALKPDYGDALTNRGATLLALQNYREAIASFDAALALQPGDSEALSNRATALFEMRRYDESAAAYRRLIELAPQFPYTTGNLVLARAYCCDWNGFAQDRARVTAELRAGKPTISPHASTLILDNAEDQLRSARRWVADRCPPSPSPLWRGEIYRHERIRVAYLSADFQAHATAFLIAGVFEQHHRNRFETIALSFGPDDRSEMRARLRRGCDRFVDVASKSDSDIAGMVRYLEVDIAVDLKGFTQGSRPGIFAQRAAPVQVNYLAHPGTMGAGYMDYILADKIVIPLERRSSYAEKIVYLPDSYQANDSARTVAEREPSRAQAGLPDTGFVFACFNNSYKITPAVFDVWMRLLRANDGSVLWLLKDNETATANLKREAEARGVESRRLVFAPRVDVAEHLARQRLADLFLDTLPCTAHTTASDALWVGLPVLTVLGTTFSGRVAASLLNAIGLPELVASSLAAYEAAALSLARDASALAALKAKLKDNRRTHALFDTARFTHNLEAAFEAIWNRTQRGEPPADLAIAPAESEG